MLCGNPTSTQQVRVLSPFEVHWQGESGQSIEVNNDFQWEQHGDLVMHATWNGVTTCSVMHHIVFEPMPGDFDLNGAVGLQTSCLLSEISCTKHVRPT